MKLFLPLAGVLFFGATLIADAAGDVAAARSGQAVPASQVQSAEP